VRIPSYSAMAIGLVLGACAGRDAQPIVTVQPQDAYSDCAMINAEILANNQRAEALASEQNAKIVQNVAAGVVGVVVWPVWFAIDAKGAASTDAAALQARQQYLSGLAAQRCAPAAPSAAVSAPAKPKPKLKPQPQPVAQAPPSGN
jgi:hypothetical protein